MMRHFDLFENPDWHGKIPGLAVSAQVECSASCLDVVFEVTEPKECHRCRCIADGEPCWQDSCVEVFVASPAHGGYYNFELNSAGVCLAEFGQAREGRRPFSSDAYARIGRKVEVEPHACGLLQIVWRLRVSIPLDLIGLECNHTVAGNLYKCASGAEMPHYLCAYTVHAVRPDFHRPECFGLLWP